MKQTDSTIRSKDTENTDWDSNASHPLQSWAWGDFRKKMGVDVVRFFTVPNERCQLTFHTIPHTPYTIGYFPKGPALTKSMIEKLKTIGKQKRAIFIQIEPNGIQHSAFSIQHSAFLKPSHHPLFTQYTFILDLTKSEDELQKAMHSKTRYNIKIAQKHSVKVKEDSSEKAFEAYLRLMKETTDRQGFYAHNEAYHRAMWNTMKESDIAHLWTATYQDKILTAWILFTWNDTIYYPYGASSREHKEVMAPYLLLWNIAQWGKAHGYKKFDLWGAIGPKPKESDPWFGFHRFKQGFAPSLVEFVGSFDLIMNPLLYPLYCLADDMRWKILKNTK